MASPFLNYRFHAVEEAPENVQQLGTRSPLLRGIGRAASPDMPQVSFNSDEAAARFYLSNAFQRDARSVLRGLSAPHRAELVPDLRLVSSQTVPQTNTRVVRFEQVQAAIPVFGSQAVVEIDQNRELVSMNADVAEIRGVSPVASISPVQALESIAKLAGVQPASLPPITPELTFYHDDDEDVWHLSYYFRKVPTAPRDFLEEASRSRSQGHGLGPSLRRKRPLLDYLVDAHDGTVLFYYSATPMVDVPTKCKGIDENSTAQDFWGAKVATGFELRDPVRFIKTYDFQFKDIDNDPFPQSVISNSDADWQTTNRAAVSAHANATRVYDFYKSILLRDGIDDKGMDLVSAVNCTVPADEPPPEWHNAVWYNNRMWYGQEREGTAEFRSYSRFLDVIAHELTHGVTELTSNLIYRNQSGALNESFSDIFGIMIKNWNPQTGFNDISKWDWEIGSGLGNSGLPLRDMSNPGRTGDPDHMNNYLRTTYDNGGVHTNSNIHNKAAHNVFTAQDQNGTYLFTPREVATLYYLCLTRLSRLADFSKTLQTLTDVANTYYAGDAAERQKKVDAIKDAYAKVGIK